MNKKELQNRVAELEAENEELCMELQRLRLLYGDILDEIHSVARYQYFKNKLQNAE